MVRKLTSFALAAWLAASSAMAASTPLPNQLPNHTPVASADTVYVQPAGTTTLNNSTAAQIQAYTLVNLFNGTWSIPSWPIAVNDPTGVFLYSTQAFTTGNNAYQDNIGMGNHTINPTTHYSPANCYGVSGLSHFCGDEVAFGAYTLSADVWGSDNTAIGDHALANNVSGKGNTAVGSSAAANISTTNVVEAFGVSACQNGTNYAGPIQCIGQASLENASTNSQYTAALGFQAGLSATDAEFSTIVGDGAAYSATTNTYSIALGEGACHNLTSISNSICIGVLNGPASGSLTGKLWIGGSQGTATPTIYGDLTTGAVGIGTASLASGAALTVAGGDMEVDAGKGVRWNNDAGFNRYNPSGINCGTGASNDYSCTLVLTKLSISTNTNITSPSTGEMDIGTGGTNGSGGHIVAAYFRPGVTTVAGLSTLDPSPVAGDRAAVNNADACTFNATPVHTTGTAFCPVVYNGTAWVAG